MLQKCDQQDSWGNCGAVEDCSHDLCQRRGDAVIVTQEKEWTNIGSRGETMIDYAVVNKEAWERVEEFSIGERVESDCLPLEISIEERNHEERGKGRANEEQKKVTIKI
jgi:hypothetical protein